MDSEGIGGPRPHPPQAEIVDGLHAQKQGDANGVAVVAHQQKPVRPGGEGQGKGDQPISPPLEAGQQGEPQAQQDGKIFDGDGLLLPGGEIHGQEQGVQDALREEKGGGILFSFQDGSPFRRLGQVYHVRPQKGRGLTAGGGGGIL